ncbi:hypothetical protein CERSUDRAFT_117549 [Gelatoporia subvermispora B]|uniref:PH domain-containing protein n=1 Tax=Ceriporiopsis subvermispora (strain B) TaxID=914234 RepID=M2R565_CERS8|nr:hypothetical protein CERSUDRAFT_117549 [Gelatoporia subvermispora B]
MEDIAMRAARKLFSQRLQEYAPADPYYETYTDKKGRQRRRKREVPPGLSAKDAKILKSVTRRAHYLDKGFNLGGMRFGWTFVIGIIPGAGDVADAALNYILVVRKAQQADIPPWLLRRMLANNAVSVVVGLIPIAGDIILAAFKANWRNAALLEEFLRIRGEEILKNQAAQQNTIAESSATPGTANNRPSTERAGSGWFRRGSKGKGKSKTEPTRATNTDSVSSTFDRGRFVEDVPPNATGDLQKRE